MSTTLPNIHPGEILLKDFLEPMNISIEKLTEKTQLKTPVLGQIIEGKTNIDQDIAEQLAGAFGTSVELWQGLQADFDTEEMTLKSI